MKNKLIQCDPSIMMGKPVNAGTRITVELILEKLAAGETINSRRFGEAVEGVRINPHVPDVRGEILFPICQRGNQFDG